MYSHLFSAMFVEFLGFKTLNAFLNTASENQVLVVLAVLAFMLLIVVTVGVSYLTAVEWRDRRRRGRDIDAMPSLKGSRRK